MLHIIKGEGSVLQFISYNLTFATLNRVSTHTYLLVPRDHNVSLSHVKSAIYLTYNCSNYMFHYYEWQNLYIIYVEISIFYFSITYRFTEHNFQ